MWERLFDLQNKGLQVFGTMDAGPHLKMICEEKNVPEVLTRFSDLSESFKLDPFVLEPGPAPTVTII